MHLGEIKCLWLILCWLNFTTLLQDLKLNQIAEKIFSPVLFLQPLKWILLSLFEQHKNNSIVPLLSLVAVGRALAVFVESQYD